MQELKNSKYFKNEKFVEALDNNYDIWIFGADSIDSITSDTPVLYIERNVYGWGDGSEEITELPIPDGHGGFDWKECRAFVCEAHEAEGTMIEERITQLDRIQHGSK